MLVEEKISKSEYREALKYRIKSHLLTKPNKNAS